MQHDSDGRRRCFADSGVHETSRPMSPMSRSNAMELPATVGLTLTWGVLGVWTGPLLGHSSGEMGVLCGLPAAVVATVRGRRTAIAAVATLVVVGLAGLCRDLSRSAELAGPAVGFAAALAALVLAGARRQEHEPPSDYLSRRLPNTSAEMRPPAEPPLSPSLEMEALEGGTSLLSMQEAGRRIATHVDLETLVPTIIATARSALKCRYAAVWFWEESHRSFIPSLPPRPRDAGRFLPNPARGIAQWVIETRSAFVASAIESSPDLSIAVIDGAPIPAGVAPLLADGELLGLLIVDDPQRPDPGFARMLNGLANLAALGIKNARLFSQMEDAARRDPLTGLLNRKGFAAACENLADAVAAGEPATLVMSDLDRFKQLNDEFGHPAGDAVLQEAARLWQASLPEDAVVARYGGEEFVAVLPGCNLERARLLIEELRANVAGHPFHYAGRFMPVTASFGLAAFDPAMPTDLGTLLHAADEQLYRAKAAGRNCVCVEPTDRACRPCPSPTGLLPETVPYTPDGDPSHGPCQTRSMVATGAFVGPRAYCYGSTCRSDVCNVVRTRSEAAGPPV